MAKQIIILETKRGTGLGDSDVRFCFWFAIPLARRVAIAGATSAYKDALSAEITALQDGSVIEEVYSMQVPAAMTIAQIKTVLQNRYTMRGAEIAALPNPNQYYGSFWDGTVWA